jgi:nucleoside-specific outer membrane channel protein Tsx
MYRRILALAGLFTAATIGFASAADLPTKAMAPVSPAPFFFVNDNTMSYWYEFTATDPGVNKTAKNVVNFTHFDVWAYGTNYFNISWLRSSSTDPANPAAPGVGVGASEIYGFFRSTLGFNEIGKTKMFSMGPLTDISLEVGADANSNNGGIGSGKTDVVAGLDFSFGLPYHGHFEFSPLYYKEWQHNQFAGIPSQDLSYDGTWAIEMVYAMPLGFLPPSIPLTFSGYANFYGPKGNGGGVVGIGGTQTTTEFHSEQRLTLDVGKIMGYHPGFYSVFVGYRYWHNKFGIDPSTLLTWTTESTWLTGATIEF